MSGLRDAAHLLVGREDQFARVVTELGDHATSGVLLLGPSGIGKTALAAAVVAQLTEGTRVLRVRGSAVLGAVPYGAFSAWLAGLPPEEMTQPVAVLRRVGQALGGSAQPGADLPLLVVDDAHDLDPGSVTLIAQLLGMRRARALFLARPSHGLPQGLDELVADGIVATVPVGPLTLDDVEELCAALLGGPVGAGLVHTVEHLTRGNPLFIRLFVRDGLTRGFITETDGVWQTARELPPLGVHLTDLVAADLGLLDPAQRDALELLAVGGPLAGDQARESIGHTVLQQLLGDGWIRARDDGALLVEHPLHAEALRASIPTARRVMLQRRILEAVTTPPRDIEELHHRTALALEAGAPLDDRILLAAATSANRSAESGFAVRAARAITSPDLARRRLVELAWARVNSGRLDEALDLLGDALEAPAPPDVLRAGTLLTLEVRMRGAASAKGMDGDVDRWEQSLADAVPAPADLRLVAVGRSIASLAVDDAPFDAVALQAVADDDAASPAARMAALLPLAVFSIGSGRPVEAARLARRALDLVGTDPDTVAYRSHALCLELLALAAAGEWDQARSTAVARLRRDARRTHFVAGWLDLLDGMRALREGRFPTAQSRLRLAVQALRTADHLHILPWITGLAAYAALLAGDHRQAALLVEQDPAEATRGTRLARLLGGVYAVAVTAVLETDVEGIPRLVRLADEAEDAGLPLVAATALDQALVMGDRTLFTRLAALTGTFDGREQALLHDFATAGAAGDAEQLLEAGDAALAAGYRPLAAASFERAREVYEKRREPTAARRAQKKFAAASAGFEGSATTEAVRLPAAVRLTPREIAVVTLVLQGLTNKEIADRHGTSVRTVEGHLYRLFMKFGISRREDLHLFAQGT
ncbi:LuxR C-terminal-related transcriptional regulator [Arthrobacter agilis]|uniref:LuxR C-terminal-related transcriptional regulator n=1 Tax=Arthrobacter agilis TaxID=37921 RepID=UPI00278B552A|nr:LuxR family transcriptional regulator [Arthrobacter agilis]MDQ0734061.1 DNA-binding CsgD family transcriptional regulator/tetratricopeptide (TPR) repeat protein [Arthrobacter agilis]